MLLGKKLLAVVPARGGSKGIKLKNLIKVGERTLIEWVASCLRETPFVDYAVVSTDHPDVRAHSEAVGLPCPFQRPPELSGDFVPDVPVLLHALKSVEEMANERFDVILMLQPTSPFRYPYHIQQVAEKLITGDWDSVLTLSKSDPKTHPLKQLCFEKNRVSYFDDKGENVIARQELSDLFYRNGVAYAMTRDCLVTQNKVIGAKASAIVLKEPTINIDNQMDVMLAEFFLEKGLVSL